MGQEKRIFGPPGTGKTELLASTIIPEAVDTFGYDNVIVCSLTKTGARTIASRTENINPKNVGTIHSICYRALGTPKLTVEKIKDWNEQHPNLALSSSGATASTALDEGGIEGSGGVDSGGVTDGEKLMSKMNIFRSKLVPEDQWPEEIKAFSLLWKDFKDQTGTLDFTDLIEVANRDLIRAPGNPNVLVVDEAQDTNPLQLRLLREWAKMMDYYVLVGDDDQTIYEFAGCTAEAFLNPPIEDKDKRVLSQSYRVPLAVHGLAQHIISRVSFREKKQYFPRRDGDGNFIPGSVGQITGSYNKNDYILEEIIRQVESGKSVMFLTSCAYMIDPLKLKLVENGIPFENEFRRRRGDWNPLYEKNNGISSKKLIQSFFASGPDENFWTVEQLTIWAKFITVGDLGLVKKIGKKVIEVLDKEVANGSPGLHSVRNVLHQVLSAEAIPLALARDIDWLCSNIQKSRSNGMKYPLKVLSKYGHEGLNKKPLLTIGTIHSVKGGQADCVIVCPDISAQAAVGCRINISDNDAMNRLFYVAVTRAKESVLIANPATKNFFKF